MSQIIEVKVPDIGDFSDVPVIDLFVKVGDTIKIRRRCHCHARIDEATHGCASTLKAYQGSPRSTRLQVSEGAADQG
jgi:hypothetical protein